MKIYKIGPEQNGPMPFELHTDDHGEALALLKNGVVVPLQPTALRVLGYFRKHKHVQRERMIESFFAGDVGGGPRDDKSFLNSRVLEIRAAFSDPSVIKNTGPARYMFGWYYDEAPAEAGAPPKSRCDPTRYLEQLWDRTGYIEIRGLAVGGGGVHRLDIRRLYTPLTTLDSGPQHGKREETTLLASRVPLESVLRYQRTVLVGAPGGGKSTFLQRIAFAACETLLGKDPNAAKEMFPGSDCPFPILVSAASLAKSSPNAPLPRRTRNSWSTLAGRNRRIGPSSSRTRTGRRRARAGTMRRRTANGRDSGCRRKSNGNTRRGAEGSRAPAIPGATSRPTGRAPTTP
ncbi:MAG TPA: hypothetical protein VIY49_21895 [Bryobacteraceae bacterium]